MKIFASLSANSWRHLFSAWLALALFDATQTVVTMRAMGANHAWLPIFIVTTLAWAVWPLVTPAVLALLQRFRWPSNNVIAWIVHCAACISIGGLCATWAALIEHASNPLQVRRARLHLQIFGT